ncbi:MAG: MinD/ParA family ATP-binding protein, partial [Turicibacter sp.]
SFKKVRVITLINDSLQEHGQQIGIELADYYQKNNQKVLIVTEKKVALPSKNSVVKHMIWKDFMAQKQNLNPIDLIIIHSDSGKDFEMKQKILLATECVVVVNPSQNTLVSTYQLLKVISQIKIGHEIKLIVCPSTDNFLQKETVEALNEATTQFLNVDLNILGIIKSKTYSSQLLGLQPIISKLYHS